MAEAAAHAFFFSSSVLGSPLGRVPMGSMSINNHRRCVMSLSAVVRPFLPPVFFVGVAGSCRFTVK
jgi:hypothetical protein